MIEIRVLPFLEKLFILFKALEKAFIKLFHGLPDIDPDSSNAKIKWIFSDEYFWESTSL